MALGLRLWLWLWLVVGDDACVSYSLIDAPRARAYLQREVYAQAVEIAAAAAEATTVGCPNEGQAKLGPVASRAQFDKVQVRRRRRP